MPDIATLESWLGEINQDIKAASPEDLEFLQGKKQEIMSGLTKAYQSENASSASPLEAFTIGMGSGMNRVVQDIAGLPRWAGQATGITPGAFDQYRQGVQEERALMDPLKARHPSSRAGEVVGEMVATLPAQLAIPGAGASRLARVAGETGVGAVQGALGSDDPLSGAVMGGALAGGVSGIGEAYKAFSRRGVPTPDAMKGVPIFPADMHGVGRVSESVASFAPFGGGAVRAAREGQQNALQSAVGRLADRNPGGGDIKTSLEARKGHRKATARRLYDRVESAVPPGPIPYQDWRRVAKDELDRELLKPEPRRDPGLVKKLEGYLAEPADADWKALRTLRSDVKSDIRGTYKGTSQVGDVNTGRLMAVQDAVEGDLKRSIPVDAAKMSDLADTFYKKNVVQPYGRKGQSIIKTAMAKETSEEAGTMFMSPRVAGNPELVERMASGLDKAGQQEMGNRLIQGMVDAGRRADGTVDPAAMSRYVNERMPAFQRMLPQEEFDKVAQFMGKIRPPREGTANLLRAGGMATPLMAGVVGASLTPGAGTGDLTDKAISGAGYLGAATAAEAGVGAIAASLAMGRPGPALNAMLRSGLTTYARNQGQPPQQQRGY